MKYFNPSFLFKLWILIIPLFHNEKQKVQSMPIKSLNNPTTLQESLTNLQQLPINLKQAEIFNHKHRHKKRNINSNLKNSTFFNGTCTNEGTTFVKLIKEDFYCGVEEPWTNNKGVAILPYVLKDNEYYYLLVKENNPLFKNKQISEYSTITGGVEKKDLNTTVINEMKEYNQRPKVKAKNETIIFLKKYKKIYEQRITKTKEKYGKSIPLLNGLQLNQEQALLKGTDLISTVSLKNNNNVLIKIKLTEQIENIYTSLFIINNQKSDTTSLLEFEDQQADTFTLLSDIYYDSTPTQSQQNLSSFIIDTSTNTKEQSPEEIEEIKDEKKYEFLNSENSQIVKNKLAQKVVYNI